MLPEPIERRLIAMSHATYTQFLDAWTSVKNIRERLETAKSISKQRRQIRQQLKGYRSMLNQMREMSHAVPSKQMANMMRRITECNERMESLESKARAAFIHVTGFDALKNTPGFSRQEPQRYAKCSSDPLLGIATYPLGFHLFVLGCTEITLRIILKRRGFERRSIGSINYYFHPGKDTKSDDDNESMSDEDDLRSLNSKSSLENNNDDDVVDDRPLPVVFVHGIGLGLLPYMPVIDTLLKSGRPIFLPEISYISAFRPWQNPNCVLQPAVVTSTMSAMLATHGYLRAAWIGHSYGTTWLSYMCQFAASTVAALVFVDPICFGLHVPVLAKQFVYSRPDPGLVSYIGRTDVVINWTVQRSFPWNWIILFLDQLGNRPCQIYLSELGTLVPAKNVEQYFRDNHVPITKYCSRQNIVLADHENVEKGGGDEEVEDDRSTDNSRNANDIDASDAETVSNRFANDSHLFKTNNSGMNNGKAADVTKKHQTTIQNTKINKTHDSYSNVNCVVFRGDGHGDWTERFAVSASIANTALDLCLQVEESDLTL